MVSLLRRSNMTREEILKEVRRFFDIDELVCDHTLAKYGQSSWNFLDTDYLHALLVIRRDIIKLPMWCNSKTQKQRGLRCNRCQLVKSKTSVYLSAHVLGKAGDFTITGMTAENARKKIKENADLLPCPIRMEADVNWLHFDVRPTDGIKDKVYEFKA